MDTESRAYKAVSDLAAERDHYREASALLDRMQRRRVILLSETQGVCVGGPFDGWLMSRHADGKWITLRKLEQDDAPVSSGQSTGHPFLSRDTPLDLGFFAKDK